tara:strand:- start:1992 stop:2270 length:279 start_codon:yes stop_codon:yes gene_type:complete
MNIEELENVKIESEQDYIEAMNRLKEEYEKFKRKETLLKNEVLELKKDLITLYGGIRILDLLSSYDAETLSATSELIENLRSLASHMMEGIF